MGTRKNMFWLILPTLFFCLPGSQIHAQTIAEKKAALSQSSSGDLDKDSELFLNEVNRDITETRQRLRARYKEAQALLQRNACQQEIDQALSEIQQLRDNIAAIEESWRVAASQNTNIEPYALMHQPDTTVEQIVIDYGTQDYIYLMPEEISKIRLSLGSNIPIPRAVWNEMLEQILAQAGIGIKQLNPFLRELYPIQTDKSGIKLITNRKEDLFALPESTRIAFMVTPEPSEVRRTFLFLENFASPNSTVVQLVGRDILIFSDVSQVLDLLNLFDFLSLNKREIEYRTVPLLRTKPEEMAKILNAVFAPQMERTSSRGPAGSPDAPNEPPQKEPFNSEANSLKVLNLGEQANGLFLIGTKEELCRAEQIISDVESQVGGARQKVIHWYTAKYSDPDELADVLYRIYLLMAQSNVSLSRPVMGPMGPIGPAGLMGGEEGPLGPLGGPLEPGVRAAALNEINRVANEQQQLDMAAARMVAANNLPPLLYPPDPYFSGGFPINPAPVRPPSAASERPRSNRTNFIVDYKTGAIVMVVEADILPEIKDLIKKLDVPKKMVHLEVLLVEKRTRNQNEFGLELLRTGACANQKNKTCLFFSDPERGGRGIFDFLVSRTKSSGIPAFDLIYHFLLNQSDISINSNPSVVTVNQTPAFIAIQEEQSINTGVFQVETAKGVTLENAYKRAQYGITIKITPTIHMNDESTAEPYDSVTLATDIVFDSNPDSGSDRPIVVRRNIVNEARVADGETIILGGLRKKDTVDSKQSIPFLGEIPGIGKLFSFNTINDSSTEMYIFITPKIIVDPACQLESIRQQEMCRRPGDIPEFMECLIEAQRRDQERIFTHTMTMILGREYDRYYTPCWQDPDTCGTYYQGEYDGR